MTIEQLLCPAVIRWEAEFRKHLNESNITMSDDEIADEFDKWLVENEDLINKSVEDNIEHINETIERNRQKLLAVNEGFFDKDFTADVDDTDDEPLTGEVDDEEDEEKSGEEEPEEKRSITGAIKLTDNKVSKYNIFGFINDFYDMVEEEHTNEMTHKGILRKLDVSSITNMAALFAFTDLPNIDLSTWDTGRVKTMEGMFYKSTFNNDSICNWDVSGCADFKNMFLFSSFSQSLKKWTPKWVEKKFRNPDGTMETKTVRADLPIIGGTEDETKAMNKIYRKNLFKTMQEEDDEAVSENKNTKDMENKLNHVIDYDTFVNEGKVKDFINKGIEKVKGFFKAVALKLGDIVAFFSNDGLMYQAISPYTSLNVVASGQIPGVSAFCAVENDYIDENVKKVADIVESPEYYGIIDKDSIEYKNYQTFKGMINEHYEKYGNTGCLQMLNEDTFKRVGFSAEQGGLRDIPDIDSKELKTILEDAIKNVPAYKGDKAGGSILIWGAPGIGKSTIPKSVIKVWNKDQDAFSKKALMVVECGDLTVDGFTLPIPVDKTVEDYLADRPLVNDIIKKSGVSVDNIEKIKRNMHKVSTEAPKTWLPCFRVSTNQDEVNILNDIANGHVEKKNEDGLLKVTETTEGGILLMDEFFRADEAIFRILMQLLLTRTYNDEFMLGNKWAIICCSNRPADDEEVERGYGSTGAVVGTRFLGGQYNFIPSFNDWKKWAVSEGGFDDVTLEFLMFEKNDEGEYTNWHTIRPEEYTKGKSGWPTPRTWSALMNELNLYKENHGYSNISDIPVKELRTKADAIIGAEMAKKYVLFLQSHAKTSVDVKRVLEDPDYKIPSDAKCSEVCRRIENYIKVVYSPDNVPSVDLLMNLFNNLDNTYKSSKDNFVKILHINIIKFLGVMENEEVLKSLKKYLDATDARFHFERADFA